MRTSSLVLSLLLVSVPALAAGPKWEDDVGTIRISLAARPVPMIPAFSGDLSGRPALMAAIAETGNEVFQRIRQTQGDWSWFRASVEATDGAEAFRWPAARCRLLLADSSRADLVDVLGMVGCGSRMTGCKAVDLFPTRNEVPYREILVADVGDCMVWVAFRIPTAILEKAEIIDLEWIVDEGEKP